MKLLLQMLRRRTMTLALWQGLFVVAVAWGVWHGYETERIAMGRMRFTMMDGTGTYYIDHMGTFQTEQKYRYAMVRDMVDAMFTRGPATGDNPSGLNAPDRLGRMFNTETRDRWLKEVSTDAKTFTDQDRWQTVRIGPIKEIRLDTDNSKASIECQIVSTGWFNGRKLDMAKSATVFLQLFVNPDMGFGKSTLVVTDYEVRYDKPELTRK